MYDYSELHFFTILIHIISLSGIGFRFEKIGENLENDSSTTTAEDLQINKTQEIENEG